MRRRWIQDPVTGKLIPENKYKRPISASYQIMPDIEPYQSMITGERIKSRSHHRMHLKQHNCIEIGNERQKPKEIPATPGIKEDLIKVCKQRGILND
jgi:hypothetical protein